MNRILSIFISILAAIASAFIVAMLILLPAFFFFHKPHPKLGAGAWMTGFAVGAWVYKIVYNRLISGPNRFKGTRKFSENELNTSSNSDNNINHEQSLIIRNINQDNDNSTFEEPPLEYTINPVELDDSSDNKEKGNNRKRKLPKWLKRLLLATSILATMLFIYSMGCLIYTEIIYPRQAREEDKQLIQSVLDNPETGYQTYCILRNRGNRGMGHSQPHKSSFYDPIFHMQGYCNSNHDNMAEEVIIKYCQYYKEYADDNTEQSSGIARTLFRNGTDFNNKYNWNSASRYYDYDPINLFNTGISILKGAAEKGDSEAQFALGCYYGGYAFTDANTWNNKTIDGQEIDNAKEAYWYLQAANQGHSTAMANLGNAYLSGKGVTKNERKGVEWIQKSADLGNAFGQRRLGDLYRDGIKIQTGSHKVWNSIWYRYDYIADFEFIIPKEIEQAKYWWKLSANNGDIIAKERLQQIYD